MGSNFSSLHSEELSKLGCSGVDFVYQVQIVLGLNLTKINFQNTYMSELRINYLEVPFERAANERPEILQSAVCAFT